MDAPQKLVSICIPAYNGSHYLRATIQSVLESTYHPIEVIVSDDASTDATPDVVRSISDPRVRLSVNADRLGPGMNWNAALERANGDYVGLLNHDDLVGPFWLTFAAHILNNYPEIGWVASAFTIVDAQGKSMGVLRRLPDTRAYSRLEVFPLIAEVGAISPSYLVRHEVLDAVGPYDAACGASADNDLFLRLAARHPLYYSAYPHLAWRRHTGNLTLRWSPIAQVEETLHKLEKVFSDPALPDDLRQFAKPTFERVHQRVRRQIRQLTHDGDLHTAQQLTVFLDRLTYA